LIASTARDAGTESPGARAHKLSQPALMDLFVAIALSQAFAAQFVPSRQVAESRDQALKLQQVRILLAQLRGQRFRAFCRIRGYSRGPMGKRCSR
jgi:hypothetical protein